MKCLNETFPRVFSSETAAADLAAQQRRKILSTRKWYKNDFYLSTDNAALDAGFICRSLPHPVGQRHLALALHGSLCFGLYRKARQIGFARMVTDLAGTVVLRDLIVAPEYRFIGLGSWMLSCSLSHPATQSCCAVLCWSSEASPFLIKNGFSAVPTVSGLHIFRLLNADVEAHAEPCALH
ncbi:MULTISPECIES: GNAT family N-acetyltransferase [Pantoea]|uniref:GNAT family N-acetyltransferase n=1 Tax=Pantoea TaxID=53335 RepID=UPI0023F6F0BD|nr:MULTISPECIES: GNAT family N-acetyltransferase [Pantoea]MBS6434861.1 GNAT family N-acetyltransferase [Pantoea sp.]MDU1573689.1 GNAT family N-acetyltransferase [Pantoea sp.]MDU2728589.1 GNAT family N-acetyltransferase [Pantoea sp.]